MSKKKKSCAAAAALLLTLLQILTMPGAVAGEEAIPAAQNPAAPGQSAAGAQAAPAPTVLTLNLCIETALKKNPTLISSEYAVEANRSRVGEARSGYYPQLSASAAYTRINSVPSLPTASLASPSYDQYSSGVTLNMNILDFGKTSSQVDVSKYNLEAARSDLEATRDAIILNVKQAYYGVLQARRNRDVAADVIKQFQLHLDQAKGFYDVGMKARIDVIKAEVDLSNAKLSLINAENAFKIAWVTLKNAMGVPEAPERTYTIEDKLTFRKFEITVEEAARRAMENRSDFKSIVARRQAAETNISFARSGHYPVLSGNANYNWSGETTAEMEQGWSAGVVLTVPLFNGFLSSHQVAEAKSNLYALRAAEESLRQQIMFEVRQAYLNLQAAEAGIATAELAVAQARENMELANGRYAAGVGSPVEVSDAFATYVTAQANHTSTLSNYLIAQANIEKAMGAR